MKANRTKEFYLSNYSATMFMLADGKVFIYSFYTGKFHRSEVYGIDEVRVKTRIGEVFVVEMLQIFHRKRLRR